MRYFAYTKKIYENPRLLFLFKAVDFSAVAFCALSFSYVALRMLLGADYYGFVSYIAALGVPFIILSLLRRLINTKRPYEVYDFGFRPKKKSGSSFPSRHAFSAFAIAVSLAPVSVPIAAVALVLAALLCICRVLLGIHFVRDVTAGALIGVVGAVLGIILL